MIISIASGKGGTGKTTLSVNLALSLDNVQLIDCDVEEPNAHIFIKPRITKVENVYTTVPEVDFARCNFCAKCAQVCSYNAIAVISPSEKARGNDLIFEDLCHNCGACFEFCPPKALVEKSKQIGVIEIGNSRGIDFIQGKLNLGQVLSVALIEEVRKYTNSSRTVLIDASPGTSCPVVTAIKGSDFCILVTEPTPFGLNDLKLSVEMLKVLKIPSGVVINRADIGDERVKIYCAENKIPVLMEIPFDRKIAYLYSAGIALVEKNKEYSAKFRALYQKILDILNQK